MTLALDPLPPPRHLPRLALEEAAVTPPTAEIATHLAACASCQTYVETLRENAARFLKARPSDRFVGQLAQVPNPPARSWRPAAGLAATTAAAATLVLVLWPLRHPAGPERDAFQFKGSLVSIFVHRRGEAVPLRAGDPLHPQDDVRFVVRADRAGFAAVLERDPKGRVTVIAPFDATRPQAVAPGSTALSDSAILDSTVGKDRFVAVFSPEPFGIASLIETLSAERTIDCKGCQVETLEFDKRP